MRKPRVHRIGLLRLGMKTAESAADSYLVSGLFVMKPVFSSVAENQYPFLARPQASRCPSRFRDPCRGGENVEGLR